MNHSKDFQDAESVRSGNSHVTSQPMSFPAHPILEGMLRPSFVSPRRKEGPPCIWDTHGISGNVFANPPASSSAPYPQELNPWGTTFEDPLHTSTVEKSERPEQIRDLRCQSGPSAKDSVIFSGGDSSKNDGADQQRLQISGKNHGVVYLHGRCCTLSDERRLLGVCRGHSGRTASSGRYANSGWCSSVPGTDCGSGVNCAVCWVD